MTMGEKNARGHTGAPAGSAGRPRWRSPTAGLVWTAFVAVVYVLVAIAEFVAVVLLGWGLTGATMVAGVAALCGVNLAGQAVACQLARSAHRAGRNLAAACFHMMLLVAVILVGLLAGTRWVLPGSSPLVTLLAVMSAIQPLACAWFTRNTVAAAGGVSTHGAGGGALVRPPARLTAGDRDGGA